MKAGKKADPTKTFTEGTLGEAAVKAAEVVGMSRPTAEKLEKVVAAADSGRESAKVVLAAVNDGTKSISAAYKEVIAPKPPKNPDLIAKIRAHDNAAKELSKLFKNGEVTRSKSDGKFHVLIRDVSPETVRKLALAEAATE
jgi:hypothetical protein